MKRQSKFFGEFKTALWQFYYCSNQFSDHGICDFYYVESYQPDHRKTEHVSRYGGRKAGTGNKKMSILLFGNGYQGKQMSALYIRTG